MATNYNPSIVTSGLVLALDAGNTRSYPGTGTTWSDLSGRGNTGTLINGPTYSSSNGGSLVFDGTNDYVGSFPASICNTEDFTIHCFFNISVLTITPTRTGILGTRTTGGWGIITGLYNTKQLSFYLFGSSSVATSATAIEANTWYCVDVTRSVSANTINLYINGSFVSTATAGVLTPAIINGTIGSENNGNYLNGRIAEVKIYNRALSDTEVLQNFNALRGRFGL